MSLTLHPYPAYKDSGVPWLGQVPAHWDIEPGLGALREKKVKNVGLQQKRVLSLSYGRIIVKPEEKLRGLVPESFETYQIVKAGDIVIRSTDLQNDKTSLRVGYVREPGIITSAYTCLTTTDAMWPKFGYQLLNTYDLSKVFYGLGSGLRQNLEWSDIKRMLIVVPPLPEQAAIVRFLDHIDRRITRYLRAKQRLIALLAEQKQAIINRAVTRGLDPDVPLKPSGVDWLGEVPAHWEIAPLRRNWTVIDCKHVTVEFQDEGIPLASVVEAQQFDLDLSKAKRTAAANYDMLIQGGRKPRIGDLVYCRNTSAGSAAYVDIDEDFAMGQDVCIIRSDGQNGRFLNYQLQSWFMKQQLESILIGATIRRINVADIKSLIVLVPPAREQNEIARWLDQEMSRLSHTIDVQRHQIDLMREYRTRLIADVVTGKLDVCGVALPDEDEIALDELPAPEEMDEVAEAAV